MDSSRRRMGILFLFVLMAALSCVGLELKDAWAQGPPCANEEAKLSDANRFLTEAKNVFGRAQKDLATAQSGLQSADDELKGPADAYQSAVSAFESARDQSQALESALTEATSGFDGAIAAFNGLIASSGGKAFGSASRSGANFGFKPGYNPSALKAAQGAWGAAKAKFENVNGQADARAQAKSAMESAKANLDEATPAYQVAKAARDQAAKKVADAQAWLSECSPWVGQAEAAVASAKSAYDACMARERPYATGKPLDAPPLQDLPGIPRLEEKPINDKPSAGGPSCPDPHVDR